MGKAKDYYNERGKYGLVKQNTPLTYMTMSKSLITMLRGTMGKPKD